MNKKISDDNEQIKLIEKYIKEGKTQKEIGEMLNMSRSSVSRRVIAIKNKQNQKETSNIVEINSKQNVLPTRKERNAEFTNHLNNIITGLESLDFLCNSVDENYSSVGSMDNLMIDIVHKIEDSKTDEELLKISKELREVRIKRRSFKDRVYIANRVRKSVREAKLHTDALDNLKSKICIVLSDLDKPIMYENRFNENENYSYSTTEVVFEGNEVEEDLPEWKKKLNMLVN